MKTSRINMNVKNINTEMLWSNHLINNQQKGSIEEEQIPLSLDPHANK